MSDIVNTNKVNSDTSDNCNGGDFGCDADGRSGDTHLAASKASSSTLKGNSAFIDARSTPTAAAAVVKLNAKLDEEKSSSGDFFSFKWLFNKHFKRSSKLSRSAKKLKQHNHQRQPDKKQQIAQQTLNQQQKESTKANENESKRCNTKSLLSKQLFKLRTSHSFNDIDRYLRSKAPTSTTIAETFATDEEDTTLEKTSLHKSSSEIVINKLTLNSGKYKRKNRLVFRIKDERNGQNDAEKNFTRNLTNRKASFDSDEVLLNYCCICMKLVLADDIFKLSNCGCKYCKNCLRTYLTIKINENNVNSLTCPDNECKFGSENAITESEILTLIDDELTLNRYRKYIFELKINLNSNLIFCSTPDCDNVCVIRKQNISNSTNKSLTNIPQQTSSKSPLPSSSPRMWTPSQSSSTTQLQSLLPQISNSRSSSRYSSSTSVNQLTFEKFDSLLENGGDKSLIHFFCNKCNKSYCINCHKEYHYNLPCKLNRRAMNVDTDLDDGDNHSDDDDLLYQLQLQQAKQQTLVRAGGKSRSMTNIFEIKRCPRCSVWIERNDGCAQMMCRKCKHVFCWFCLQNLEDDLLLRHYDTGPCKNKLGHSRASVVWHRTQVIGIFAGFGFLLLLASPLFLLAAPCILCCNCCCSSEKSASSSPTSTSSRTPITAVVSSHSTSTANSPSQSSCNKLLNDDINANIKSPPKKP